MNKFKILLNSGVCVLSVLLLNPLFANTEMKDSGYKINVVNKANSNAKIIRPSVQTRNGNMWLTGKLKRQNRHQRVPFGHIDVSIVGSNGVIIVDHSVAYSPSRVHKEIRKASHFALELASAPPKGSVISLSYHKDTFHHSHAATQHDKKK